MGKIVLILVLVGALAQSLAAANSQPPLLIDSTSSAASPAPLDAAE